MSTREEYPETWLLGTESVPAVNDAAEKLQASLAEARAQASQVEQELLALQCAVNAPDGVAEPSVSFRNPALQSIHQTILSMRRAASAASVQATAAAATGVDAQQLQRSSLSLLAPVVRSVGAQLAGRHVGAIGETGTAGESSALHLMLADFQTGDDEVGRMLRALADGVDHAATAGSSGPGVSVLSAAATGDASTPRSPEAARPNALLSIQSAFDKGESVEEIQRIIMQVLGDAELSAAVATSPAAAAVDVQAARAAAASAQADAARLRAERDALRAQLESARAGVMACSDLSLPSSRQPHAPEVELVSEVGLVQRRLSARVDRACLRMNTLCPLPNNCSAASCTASRPTWRPAAATTTATARRECQARSWQRMATARPASLPARPSWAAARHSQGLGPPPARWAARRRPRRPEALTLPRRSQGSRAVRGRPLRAVGPRPRAEAGRRSRQR